MYIDEGDYAESLFENNTFKVVVNPKADNFMEASIDKLENTVPNYLVINFQTSMIEFASDQLPAAIEVANRLEAELDRLTEIKSNKIVEIKKAN